MHAAIALRSSERVRTGSVLHFELPFTFNTSASNHLIFHLVFMYIQRFFRSQRLDPRCNAFNVQQQLQGRWKQKQPLRLLAPPVHSRLE